MSTNFAKVEASTSGNTTIVAPVEGKRIRVVNYTVMAASAVVVRFRSGDGTDLTGPMAAGQNGGASANSDEVGCFQTKVGEALLLHLATGVSVGGHLAYLLVD